MAYTNLQRGDKASISPSETVKITNITPQSPLKARNFSLGSFDSSHNK